MDTIKEQILKFSVNNEKGLKYSKSRPIYNQNLIKKNK